MYELITLFFVVLLFIRNFLSKEILYSFHYSPAGASLQLVPNSKFTILSRPPHCTTAHCPPPFWGGGTGVRTSPAGASLQLVPNSKFSHPSHLSHLSYPSHNSKFKIHNSPIPLALFRAHYRLKKHLSLWWVKENRVALFLYCVDF